MKLMYRNVTFYIGDITKPDDVRNAINKVSLVSDMQDEELMIVWSYCCYPHCLPRPWTRQSNL